MDQVPFSQTKEGSLFGEPRVNCLRINNPVCGGIELIEQRPLLTAAHQDLLQLAVTVWPSSFTKGGAWTVMRVVLSSWPQ